MVLYNTLHSRVQSIHSAGAERKKELGVGVDGVGLLGAATVAFAGAPAVLTAGVPFAVEAAGALGGVFDAAADDGLSVEDGGVGAVGVAGLRGDELAVVSLVCVYVPCRECAPMSFE